MKNPLVSLVRALAVRRNSSKVKTAFVPLGKLHSASVIIDADQSDSQNCADFVTAFFSKCGISLSLYALSLAKEPVQIKGATLLSSKDISVFGLPRKGRRHPQVKLDTDLFINLTAGASFAADYSAICSSAKMKVGRRNPGRSVYDLLILNSENYTQSEVFKQMSSIMLRIK